MEAFVYLILLFFFLSSKNKTYRAKSDMTQFVALGIIFIKNLFYAASNYQYTCT